MPKYLELYPGKRPPLTPLNTCEALDRDALPQQQGRAEGRECARCDLAHTPGIVTRCIGAEGEPGGLLLVGESPGRDENMRGRPFVGQSGKYLRDLVAKHWTGPVAFDNALRCLPVGKDNKRRIEKAVDACRGYLKQTFSEVAPTRIVTVGSLAALSVLGRSVAPFTNRRGYAYLQEDNWLEGPIPVFMVIHPAAALRNRFVRQWFESDLKWALTSEKPRYAPWHEFARLVTDEQDALDALDAFIELSEWIAFDVETVGIMWTDTFSIISVAVCGSHSDSPWVWSFDALRDPAMRAPLLKLLALRSLPKAGANVKYDQLASRCQFNTVTGPIAHDVRLLRKLLEPEASGALADMSELVGMGGYKQEFQGEQSKRLAFVKRAMQPNSKVDLQDVGIPPEVEAALRLGANPDDYKFWLLEADTLHRYNARDSVATARLVHKLEDDLKADVSSMRRTWETIVRPASVALERVEAWGVPVDRRQIEHFDTYLHTRETKAKATLDQYAPGVNWGSPKQVGEVLFDKLRLKPPKLTKTGQRSTDDEVLTKLATKHPLASALAEHRFLTRMRGTYASGMLEHVRDDNSSGTPWWRIHPNVKLDGARSGRTSCIRRGTPIEIVRNVEAYPLGIPVEDVKIGDLAYCYDDAGKLHTRKVVRTWARGRRSLVRVHWRTAGGRSGYLDLTSDHRLGKVDGSWCQAGALQPGDRLRALSRSTNDGYQNLFATDTPRMREHRFLFEEAYGWSPEHVHHKNDRRADNRLDNLEGMTASAHHSHHGGENTPTYLREFRSRKLKEQHALGLMPPPAGERNGSWRSLSLEEATDLLRKHAWSICHAAKADGRDFTCFKRHLVELGFDVVDLKRMNRDTRRAQILAGAANARAARKENNHVVTRVEVLGVEDDVFDLMIEEHHNFIAGELSSANCTDPNLQNIPRASGSPEGKMARDCFAAPPGYKLVELDYSQLELRVACLLSGDPKMLEIFRSGVDYHLRTAQLVSMTAWGVDLTNNSVSKEDAKEYRTRAKAVNFGALYGKGAGGLAEEWGCSMSKAQEVIDLIMGQFKVLDRWCDDRLREAQKTGVVWTWWDGENARRRPLYRVADKSSENDKSRSVAENGAVNSPIQGTASDFCVSSLTACIDWIEQDRLDGVKLVLPVHDALMFEVRDDMVDEVAHVAAHIMRSWPFGDVPLVVDCKVGQSWGTMEEYDVAA